MARTYHQGGVAIVTHLGIVGIVAFILQLLHQIGALATIILQQDGFYIRFICVHRFIMPAYFARKSSLAELAEICF